MPKTLRYLLIGFLLGCATWMLLAPEWSIWLAFVVGEVVMLFVFTIAATFDWVVGKWLRGEHDRQ